MKITIITACFNSAGVIATAMESVLRQSWQDIEYLVVDGGSSDDTLALVQAYEPLFQGRMRWLSAADGGMYDAINKGIAMATGEVVGILNADDALASDRVIEQVVATFEAGARDRQTDVLYGDIRFVARDAGSGTAAMPAVSRPRAEVATLLAQLRAAATLRYYSARRWRPWMLRWGYMPPHPSVYIRRSCFERLGNYALDYKIAADYALLIRFLQRACLTRAYLPVCMVVMRAGGVSTRGWRSNLLLNQEIVRGNREAGYFCVLPMLLPKYLFKIWEYLPRRRQRGAWKEVHS